MSCAGTAIGKFQVWSSIRDSKWWRSRYGAQLPPLKPWFDSPVQPNPFYLIASKLDCGNDRERNHKVMCGWHQLTLGERQKLRVWEQWNWCMLVDCWGWVVNLFYYLCAGLLKVGSLAKGIWMFGWLGQLPEGQEISMEWEQNRLGWGDGRFYQECLPSPPSG